MGVWIILGSVLTTINLWLLAQTDLALSLNNPWLAAGRLTALLGTLLIALSFVLSTRWKFVEKLFGGLDKVYRQHHITGGLATVLLLHHPVLLAMTRLDVPAAARQLFVPGSNLAYNAGIFALWTLVLVILLTLFVRLPYQWWRLSHKLIHLGLLFSAVHVLLIGSDVGRNPLLAAWMWAWLGLGLYAALYQLVLSRWLAPQAAYRVKQLQKRGPILELLMEPVNKALEYHAGQFVYFAVDKPGFSREAHPFSITTPSGSSQLGLVIKASGDYTRELLHALAPGDTVKLRGPFGQFGERFRRHRGGAVMIAGGIGVTPFLGMLSDPLPAAAQADLLYCTRDHDDAWFAGDLQQLCALQGVRFQHHLSQQVGYLTGEKLRSMYEDFKQRLYLLCGPPAMMESLRADLVAAGVRPSRIVYEDFSFK